MARIIDLSNPYVLTETGDEVEKVLGLPFRAVQMDETEKAQLHENVGLPEADDTPTEGSTNLVTSGGVYAWVLQQIQALKTVSGIAITTPPTKTLYRVGEALDLSGIVVTATYTDGTTADVTGECVFSPAAGDTLSGNAATQISATYRTATASMYVNVTTPYIDLHSDSAFTLKPYNTSKNWDGTLETSTNGSSWTEWTGSELTAGSYAGEYHIMVRGTGNTKITGSNENRRWVLGGSGVKCSGDVTMLLDYQNPGSVTLANSGLYALFYGQAALIEAPQLSLASVPQQGYAQMFYECTNLPETPILPARTIGNTGCAYMFSGCSALEIAHDVEAETIDSSGCASMFALCTSLQTAPAFKAKTIGSQGIYGAFSACTALTRIPVLRPTVLAATCYKQMFRGCSAVKLSATKTGAYQYEYRIPAEGTGTPATDALLDMFANTGGTFTGTPTINTVYYTDHAPVA